MNFENDIWVLTDSKIGSNNQAIALAEKLGRKYDILNVDYNFFASIPNMLLPKNFIQVKNPKFKLLLKNKKPKLVISASRKTALVSASIKKIDSNIKNIHILRPGISLSNYDLVAIPQHDKNIKNEYSKVIRYIGALNNVPEKIERNFDKFSQYYSEFIDSDYASVLIGGNTKKYNYTKSSTLELIEKLKNISLSNNIKLFITFSRRTPKFVKNIIKDLFVENSKIYDPNSDDLNPYPAMLKKSKFVIATCDSISMLSEIASTGKSLFLFIPTNFNSFKHKTFAYQLMDLEIAKIINKSHNLLQEYNYSPLNETKKVSDYVNSMILGVK